MFNPPPSTDRNQYQSRDQALASMMVILALVMIGMLSGIIALGILAHVFDIGNAIFSLTICLIAIPVCTSCIFGVVTLLPASRRPVDFTPDLSVPPEAEGQPFDVRLAHKGSGQSFSGTGVVQFFPDHMTIDGTHEINGSIPFGIFVAVTLALKLFGPQVWSAIGLLPALIVARYIGRKKIVQTIPYHAIRGITVDGNTVTLACPGLSPSKSSFYVASADGPRLHGELHPRFAALLQDPLIRKAKRNSNR